MRWAVFASGSGTHVEYLVMSDLRPDLVVVDRECGAHQIAVKNGIQVLHRCREDYSQRFNREEYTRSLTRLTRFFHIELVAMAGFKTILSEEIFDHFGERILNVHPSLLPKYKGPRAVRDALAAGEKVTGCTVHVAVPEMDSGPIVAQREVSIFPEDSVESLHERIKEVERPLYAGVIRSMLAGTRQAA